MNIVRLFIEDSEKIEELFKSDFKDGYNLNVLKSSFNSGRFYCYALKEEEELISVICASATLEEADVDGLVTKTLYKRKGYAKLLVNFLIKELEKTGVKKVFLEVRESNLPAKNLYLSLGFNEINVRKGYYSNGENAIIMLKEI